MIFLEKVGEVETQRTNSASYEGSRRSYLYLKIYLSSGILIGSNLHSQKARPEKAPTKAWPEKAGDEGLVTKAWLDKVSRRRLAGEGPPTKARPEKVS